MLSFAGTKLPGTAYTKVLFQHGSVDVFTRENDYRFARATGNIRKGSLLLLEHAIRGPDGDSLIKITQKDSLLYNALYPRNADWTMDIAHAKSSEVTDLKEKVLANGFKNDESWIIGCRVSNFNHSSSPNAIVGPITLHCGNNLGIGFICVEAASDIASGEEITISYGDGKRSGTGFDFISDSDIAVDPEYVMKTTMLAKRIATQYCGSDVGMARVAEQELARLGVYTGEKECIFAAPRWIDYSNARFPGQDYKVAVGLQFGITIRHLERYL